MVKKKSVENLERLQRQWQRQRQRQRRGNQWKAGGRPIEEMIIFMKQIDKAKLGREFRESTEAVAETEAEKRPWNTGGRSLEEMIIFMSRI